MPKGFDNYEKLVLVAYRQKRGDGSLLTGLMHPTPASLRDECLRACRDRFSKKDEKVIRDFFIEGSSSKTCMDIIDQCDINKFKQIIKYLKRDGAIKTKEKNILLLAWLIDFKERPYEYDKDYPEASERMALKDGKDKVLSVIEMIKKDSFLSIEGFSSIEENGTNQGKDISLVDSKMISEKAEEFSEVKIVNGGTALESIIERIAGDTGKIDLSQGEAINTASESNNEPDDTTMSEKKSVSSWRSSKTMVAGSLLAILLIGGCWWWGVKPEGGCMYWDTDHYQPIPCNQKVPNTRIRPLDTLMVKYFKKITQPDTITNRAKGYVWYSKISNKVEFFTASGEHPVFVDKVLKPLSDHIIKVHVHPGMTSN